MNRVSRCLAIVVMALPLAGTSALADDASSYNLVMNKDKFTPDRMEVPAEKKISILIDNQSGESEKIYFMVNHERVLPASEKTKVFIGPLDPGEYKFVGNYHPDRTFVIVAR